MVVHVEIDIHAVYCGPGLKEFSKVIHNTVQGCLRTTLFTAESMRSTKPRGRLNTLLGIALPFKRSAVAKGRYLS